MHLYEISDNYRAFLTAVEAGEIPEDAIADTLDGIQGAFEVKADAVACMVKELAGKAQMIKDEADRLTARAKAKKAHADRLTQYLYRQMQRTKTPRIETPRNRLSIMRTPAACVIDDEAVLLTYLTDRGMEDCIKREASIRKAEVARLLKNGAEMPGVHMEAGTRLDIK